MAKAKGPRASRGPDRPWRLGIKLGGRFVGDNSTMAIGWAAIELDGPPEKSPTTRTGVEYFEDDAVAAIVRTIEAQRPRGGNQRPEVELTSYLTEQSFAGSRAAAEGMTIDQHRLLMVRVANELRARFFTVRFRTV